MKPEEIPPSALTACGTCGAPAIWAETEKGKRMMVNREPGGTGEMVANLVLTVVAGKVKSRVVAKHLAFGNRSLHLSHFATCPQASKHRTRRRSHAERRLP